MSDTPPTPQSRALVKAMAAYGIPPADIGLLLGVPEAEVAALYAHELAVGGVEANAKVAQSLHAAAMGGDVKAMQAWLTARAGWFF